MSEIDDIVILLRRGNQHAAFERLRVYLTQHPDDAIAWFWLSEATPQLSRKVEALRRFLALAPDHPRSAAVRGRLGYLEAQLAATPPEPEPKPTVPITYEPDEPADEPSVETAPQEVVRTETHPQPTVPSTPTPVEQTPPVPAPTTPPASVATRPSSIGDVPEGLTPIEPSRMPSTYRLSSLGTGMRGRPASEEDDAPHSTSPAVPGLLQSLLDTAPQPPQRPDTITLQEVRPYPPAPEARRTPDVPASPTAPSTTTSEPTIQEPVPTLSAPPTTTVPTPTHTEVPAQPPITVIIQERMPVWAWVLAFLMVVQIGLQAYMIFTMQLMIAALTR